MEWRPAAGADSVALGRYSTSAVRYGGADPRMDVLTRALRLTLLAVSGAACATTSPAPPPSKAPTATEADTRLTWQVLDRLGKPVSRADGFWILDGRPAHDDATALRQRAEGVSDSEGNLRLPPPPKGAKGYFSVWVFTGAGGTVCVDEGLYDGESWAVEIPYDLPTSDRRFSLKVVDHAGSPMPGVTARVCRSADGAPLPFLPVLHADADGHIDAGPFEYGNYWMDLVAPGTAPIRVCPYHFSVEDAAGYWYGPIVLPPGRAVRGRVTADGSDPPEGAWVRVTYDSTAPNETCSWFIPLAPDGTFHVTVRADRLWTLAAGAPGRAEISRQFRRETKVLIDLPLRHVEYD
jgi:hypothetical protein